MIKNSLPRAHDILGPIPNPLTAAILSCGSSEESRVEILRCAQDDGIVGFGDDF
jgi:hypothetical protein